MPPTRSSFPPVVTASDWGTAWQTAFSAAFAKRGKDTAPDGETMVPRITHGEAVALIRAWQDAAGAQRFPLWSQFAGQAFAWDPSKGDKLNTSIARRDAIMSSAVSHELWIGLYRIASDLDDEPDRKPVRLAFDAGAFDDPVYQATVRASLALDGGTREIERVNRAKSANPAKRKRRAPRSSLSPVLMVGALWLMFGNKQRRYRRTR